jgi:hypothetical protein
MMSFYYCFTTLHLNGYLVCNITLFITYKLHNNIFLGNYPSNFVETIQSVLNSIYNHSVSTMKCNYDQDLIFILIRFIISCILCLYV